jgi:cob(I)alamin adenosyltransferase
MDRGLVHIYTGDGKGKTTAAMGLAFRAAGQDKKVYILQFLKARKTGEKISAEKFDDISFERANKSPKFTFQMNEDEKKELLIETREVWGKLIGITRDSKYDIIIIDEIMGAIISGMVEVKDVVDLIKNKDETKEIILTGRDAPQELIELADYVTEMRMIKHPYTQNVSARKGIEF